MDIGDELQGIADAYRLEGLVGEGGFGLTYRATRISNGERVAIKRMRLEKVDNWKALELFEREASVLRALDHPRIPSYIEFFATTSDGPVEHRADGEHAPDSLVLVQDLVDGSDLQRRMAMGERFEVDTLLQMVRAVAETLDYLHGLSPPVIHRDVNPRNIVLDGEGQPFLVDFGAIQQTLQEATIGGSTAVGSLGFMPIEQSLGKAKPASDLYALGVTTLVLMTGMQPEDLPLDESLGKIDLAALGVDPTDSDRARARLALFLDRALEPIVGQRVSTARGVLDLLDGKDSLVPVAKGGLAKAGASSWKRTLFLLCLGGSLGSAGIIYPLNFNNFSETRMVEMAPFWVLPAAFGFFGLLVQKSKRPIANAVIATVGAALLLAFFFAVIFPAL